MIEHHWDRSSGLKFPEGYKGLGVSGGAAVAGYIGESRLKLWLWSVPGAHLGT